MYLNAFRPNLVMSAAVQILKSGKVVADVYNDSKPRSYDDCVKFGYHCCFSSLSEVIDFFLLPYEKVIISNRF